jgi:hypothetical protein
MADTSHSAGRREISAHVTAQPKCSCFERIYPTGNVQEGAEGKWQVNTVGTRKEDYILISDR